MSHVTKLNIYTEQISAIWTSTSEIIVLCHTTNTMISRKLNARLFLLTRNKAGFRGSRKNFNNGAFSTACNLDKLLYTLLVSAFELAGLDTNAARNI